MDMEKSMENDAGSSFTKAARLSLAFKIGGIFFVFIYSFYCGYFTVECLYR